MSEWLQLAVRDAGEVMLGRQRSPDQMHGRHIRPYLRVANVFLNRIDFGDVLRMNFTPEEQRRYYLRTGDILLNEGQSIDLVGRSAIYNGPAQTYCFQNTLVRFRADKSVLLPEYAQLIFEQWFVSGEFSAIARQTTSIAHLGADRFGDMRLRLPSIESQEEAVLLVGSIDRTMDLARQEFSKLGQLRAGLLVDVLRGSLAASP